MPTFALILILAFFGKDSNSEASNNINNLPVIEFSQSAIDFESGQPVFTTEMQAVLKTANLEDVRVVINDQVDLMTTSSSITLTSLIELSEGTYTVMIQGKGFEETFGFTIR